MSRPATITDNQILDAARAVFLAEGVNASTLEIARRAGVSEGSIFKRFGTKERLFDEALQVPPVPGWIAELDTLPGDGDLKETLIAVSLKIVAFFQEIVPRVVVARGARPCHAEPRDDAEPPPARDRRALARFLRQEMERGRLRPCDPDLVARMLLGSLFSYVFDSVAHPNHAAPQAPDEFVRGVVQVIWEGIAPLPEA
jgi:AcrR family transcriptional regulator